MLHILDFDSTVRDDVDDDVVVVLVLKASVYLIYSRTLMARTHRDHAGLGGSAGCAVRLDTRRSWVQPPRSATFFRGD